MAVATTKKLSDLHGKLADTFVHALKAEDARMDRITELTQVPVTDENAEAVSKILALAPTARVDTGLLKTISSFLKDNSITTDLGEDAGASDVKKALDELHKKRKTRVASTPMDELH